jgi:hypothetical protein
MLPPELSTGLEFVEPEPEWTWMAFQDGKPVALLSAQKLGNVAMLTKLNSSKGSFGALTCLVRHALIEMRKRGLSGYVCFFNQERREEQMLAEIMRKASPCIEMKAVVIAAKLPEGW